MPRWQPYSGGFTFLELLVAVLILGIASVGTVGVMSSATRQARRNSDINDLNTLNTLIDSDLAEVRKANDRFVCRTGPDSCTVGNADPTETDYFPAIADPTNVTTSEQANIEAFVNLCRYWDGSGFNPNSGFAAQMITTAAETTDFRTDIAAAVDARLVREVDITPNNEDLGGHRYTVIYRSNDGDPTILRQVTLTPATVAWCPCVPSDATTANQCPLTGP